MLKNSPAVYRVSDEGGSSCITSESINTNSGREGTDDERLAVVRISHVALSPR